MSIGNFGRYTKKILIFTTNPDFDAEHRFSSYNSTIKLLRPYDARTVLFLVRLADSESLGNASTSKSRKCASYRPYGHDILADDKM